MSIYLISYAASFLFARVELYPLSGLSLMIAAVYLYVSDYRKSKNLIHLRGLFSLFWVGGQGVSCLKLSKLQGPWSFETWVCLMFAFIGFWATFELLSRYLGNSREERPKWHGFLGGQQGIYHCILAVTLISLAAFLLEAFVLGYVPLFVRGVPHAYSEFHISGVHYFTVSCVLVPALSILYFYTERGRKGGQAAVVLTMDAIALLIPILCVSRFQLILAVAMAVFTYIVLQKNMELYYVAGLILLMVPLYILLTVARSHDVTYLNGIFEMKYDRTPIFITQPYMYIANNYDNLNCLVEQLPAHTWGLRMLFPVFALTGLKFLKPALVSFPIFVTKPELTTVTLFYDAYYDFGLIGVLLFSCLLGAVSYYLVTSLKKIRNPIGYLFYVQLALYLVFSFFTTWFSNPTTWFYLVVTGILYVYCSFNRR